MSQAQPARCGFNIQTQVLLMSASLLLTTVLHCNSFSKCNFEWCSHFVVNFGRLFSFVLNSTIFFEICASRLYLTALPFSKCSYPLFIYFKCVVHYCVTCYILYVPHTCIFQKLPYIHFGSMKRTLKT